jgi:HAD superfamily hydrolase (TIGR01509 family)
MDGVLVDAKEIHYNALNNALSSIDDKYVITKKEHLLKYDGNTTSTKLQMLTKEKGLPEEYHDQVWNDKQKETFRIINEEIKYDERIRSILCKLKDKGYALAVASNSIRHTVKMILLNMGYVEYFDFFLSNEDVKNPKPNTEIYLQCMIKSGFNPKETLIIEDSDLGRKAAQNSGAYLLGVNNSSDVTYDRIMSKIKSIDNKIYFKWQDNNMNVLIPMAGAGSRFEKAGYTFPKPLIEVNGKPMIQVVTENLAIDANYIYIVQKEHYEKYELQYLLNLITPGCKIIQIEGVTEGAACTTLLAKEFIDNDSPLIIANSDQFVEWDSGEFVYSMSNDIIDGGILTFKSTHPKWSYAKLGDNGFVSEVAEKKPISDIATVGIYYWKKGSDYVKSAEQMIEKNVRVNNEFYVCPVFNEAIENGLKVKTFNIEKMWGIGTPEDLDYFTKNYEGSV